MKPEIDLCLEQLRREPLPAIGAGFEAGVWRLIAQRRESIQSPWWTCWQNPRLAFASAAAAAVIGLGTAWMLPAPRLDDRAALGLDAFAANAPHLPATLIARR